MNRSGHWRICRSCNPIDLFKCADCGVQGCKHHVMETRVAFNDKRLAYCFECVAALEDVAKGITTDEGEFL